MAGIPKGEAVCGQGDLEKSVCARSEEDRRISAQEHNATIDRTDKRIGNKIERALQLLWDARELEGNSAVLERSEEVADEEPAETERTSCLAMDMGTLQSHDSQQFTTKAINNRRRMKP